MDESSDKSTLIQILDTAQGLFIRHGYQGLSMRQIAEAVGVTKAALYYYFKDKEQLFLAVMQRYLDGIETQIDQIIAEQPDARTRIRQFVKALLDQGGEGNALIRLAGQDIPGLSQVSQTQIKDTLQTSFVRKIRVILADGMQHGELRQIDPEIATWLLIGMLYHFLPSAQSESAEGENQPLEDLLLIFLHGISNPGHF